MRCVKISDLGYKKCHFIARGDSEDEILKSIYSHTRRDHPELIRDITLSQKQEIRQKVRKILLNK